MFLGRNKSKTIGSGLHPNLFILGVAKSATTTLADALRQHPEIFITAQKEPTFFSSDEEFSKGIGWYTSNYFKKSYGYKFRGEASPSYLYFGEKVAKRIKENIPDPTIRFIVIFRNPIDRAYSHYWHNVLRGLKETLSFMDALSAEESRLEQNMIEYQNKGRIRYAYYSAGLYANQLEIFWKYFPKESFILLLQEDLYKDNFSKTISAIQAKLELDIVPAEYQHSNYSYRIINRSLDHAIRKKTFIKELIKRWIPPDRRFRMKSSLLKLTARDESYPPMDPDIRKMLIDRYIDSIVEFEKIIGRDLSNWYKQ